MVATNGLHTSAGEECSAGVIPDTGGRGEVDTEQAGRVGLKFNQSKKKWVYQPYGESTSDCLSGKEAALGFLSATEKQVEEGHLEGVLLVNVLDDLTLAHLLIIMKRNGLVPRFKILVVGISNLESV